MQFRIGRFRHQKSMSDLLSHAYAIGKDFCRRAAMAITSLDILNLSHSLKDICEVNCNTPECLSQMLKLLMQYNLIQANLQFGKQFGPIFPPVCPPACPTEAIPAAPAPTVSESAASSKTSEISAPSLPAPVPDANTPTQRPAVRLDIGDPFLDDYEK